MNRFTRGLLVAALIAACTDSPLPPSVIPPEPAAATSLTLSLQSPGSDDGGILLELKGPALGAVTPADPTWAFSSEMVSDSVLRVAIVGIVSNAAPLVSVQLTDPRSPNAYRATILEVTDRAGQLPESLASYRIEITGR